MKRIGVLCIVALVMTLAPALFAQNHGEVNVFVDYMHVNPTDTNNVGLGGRVGFHVAKHVQLEGEMGYLFNRAFLENCTDCPIPVPAAQNTDLRILHGFFGPKFQTGDDDAKARFFVFAKGGFVNIGLSNRPVTFGNFGTSVENLRTQNVNGSFYPGAGVEFYAGPIGLRFDVGDEIIFFQNQTENNIRVNAGPSIRF
jgi:hypothetical protein